MTPIDRPSFQPLVGSSEADQLESELKTVFLTVFEDMIRARERQLNLYGMAHLGEAELVERNLKEDGLAVIRRDDFRLQFLLKAWRSRNPKRGLLFLRKYLQAVWPNEWEVEQLWHPLATADQYPLHKTPIGNPDTHFLTSRVQVSVSVEADTGLGLVALQKALRSTLAARLVLELILSIKLANTGNNGLALSNGASGIVPLYTTGKLAAYEVITSPLPLRQGAVIGMPVKLKGSMTLPPYQNAISISSGAGIDMPVNLVGTLSK